MVKNNPKIDSLSDITSGNLTDLIMNLHLSDDLIYYDFSSDNSDSLDFPVMPNPMPAENDWLNRDPDWLEQVDTNSEGSAGMVDLEPNEKKNNEFHQNFYNYSKNNLHINTISW